MHLSLSATKTTTRSQINRQNWQKCHKSLKQKNHQPSKLNTKYFVHITISRSGNGHRNERQVMMHDVILTFLWCARFDSILFRSGSARFGCHCSMKYVSMHDIYAVHCCSHGLRATGEHIVDYSVCSIFHIHMHIFTLFYSSYRLVFVLGLLFSVFVYVLLVVFEFRKETRPNRLADRFFLQI